MCNFPTQGNFIGSRIFDLQQVRERGAIWACHSDRRIREWEAQSGVILQSIGFYGCYWCGEGGLKGRPDAEGRNMTPLQAQSRREKWPTLAQTAEGRAKLKAVRLEGKRGGRKPLLSTEPLLTLAVEDCVLLLF